MSQILFTLVLITSTWLRVTHAQTPAVQPLFTCWFTSYGTGQPINNIVMGYNNSFNLIQNIISPFNRIAPADYDSDLMAYDLFSVGYVRSALVISDTLGVLSSSTIQWIINDQSVVVSFAGTPVSLWSPMLYRLHHCPTGRH